MRVLVVFLVWTTVCRAAETPVFTPVRSFQAARLGSAAWGDYDNDGDLDLILTGNTWIPYVTNIFGITEFTYLYRNDGSGQFTVMPFNFPAYRSSTVEWGDFDNDGFIDLMLTGWSPPPQATRIYKNLGGTNFVLFQELPVIYEGSAAWGDYNQDGLLDLALTGRSVVPGYSQIFQNQNKTNFSVVDFSFQQMGYSAFAWGDYDNDGYQDLFQAGAGTRPLDVAYLLRNERGNGFTGTSFGPSPASGFGVPYWLDVNNDGWLDLALPIHSQYLRTFLYINRGDGTFTATDSLPLIGAVAIGDYDNDGLSDVLISGYEYNFNSGNIVPQKTRLYRNGGDGSWTTFSNLFMNVEASIAAWGDYDNDGDLDLFLAGQKGYDYYSQLYRNETATKNSPPSVPGALRAIPNPYSVLLNWNPSTDFQQRAGLTYNVRVGTAPGSCDIVSPMSAADGFRRVVKRGNSGSLLSYVLNGLQMGEKYYWSVQAVDNAFGGSPFAAEQSFIATTYPKVSEFTDASVLENTSLAIPFKVSDAETAAADLNVTAFSSDTRLFPPESLAIAGSGTDRTLWLTPALNATGRAVITLRVVDADGARVDRGFVATVLSKPEAIDELIDIVAQSALKESIKRALIAILERARESFERGDDASGAQFLEVFVHKVRAQVERLDPGLAAQLSDAVRTLLSAIGV